MPPTNLILTYTPEEDEALVEGSFKSYKAATNYIEGDFIGGEDIVIGDPIKEGTVTKWEVYFDGNDYPSGTLTLTSSPN